MTIFGTLISSWARSSLATEQDVDVVYGALMTYSHGLGRQCILWRPYDRQDLLRGNFLDTNVIVHRRSLIDRYGGWDQDGAPRRLGLDAQIHRRETG